MRAVSGFTVTFALLAAAACATVPRTGEGVAGLDRAARAFMARWNVPGLAVAVAADGRLVAARGYGHARPGAGEAVRPDTLFRIASASKPVTAVAVMKLVEAGRLAIDEPVFESILPGYPARCSAVDTRVQSITVRHLLIHASGWDTSGGVDPMFNAARIARRLDMPGLEPAEAAIQREVCSPLQFPPGSKHVYENLNYAVLGRVIEAVAGTSYEDFVKARVFRPLGITRPRIGGSRRSARLPDEAVYVARGSDRRRVAAAVGEGRVPLQYGGFDLAAMDSHGGWVASAPDLVRLMAGVDGNPRVPDILGPPAIERMGRRPGSPIVDRDAGVWYAKGWYRTRAGAWFHDGSLPGATAFIGMEPDGVLYAALANTRHPNPEFAADFREAIRDAVRGVRRWPARDLFPAYGYPAPGDGR